MSHIVDESLQKIARGTSIVIFGTVIGMPLTFAARLIIIRYVTQHEYGMYALAMVLLNFVVAVSLLGLQEGSARYIAYYRGKEEEKKVKTIVFSSVQIVLMMSVLSFLVLFLFSDFIAAFFDIPEFSAYLKVFSAGVPFLALMNVFVSIFRGFDRVEPKVYFLDILRNSVFILLLLVSIGVHAHFQGVVSSYVLSLVITSVAFAVYFGRKIPVSFSKKGTFPVNKELLKFSLPLLLVVLLNMIIYWTDTVMLGYFKSPDIVGLYNADLSLARLIPLALFSSASIYVPIVSKLYSRGLMEEIKRTYQVLTKWIFSVTIPGFFIIFLFPGIILNFLFGADYAGGGPALRLLSLGFMVHTFLGLQGLTLVIMGNSRFVMMASFCGAVTNVVLNIGLIPTLGAEGAALASLSSYVVVNLLNLAKLHKIAQIHPFTRNYVKPVTITGVLVGGMFWIQEYCEIRVLMLPFILLFFLGCYGGLLLVTKSFDREDIQLLLAIEKKVGIDLGIVKSLLRKFL